jgi:hypothetical protein
MLYRFLLGRAQPIMAKQPLYPRLTLMCRSLYLSKRALSHLRFMDFSVLTGMAGYRLWQTGFIGFWKKYFVPEFKSPAFVGDSPRAIGGPLASEPNAELVASVAASEEMD